MPLTRSLQEVLTFFRDEENPTTSEAYTKALTLLRPKLRRFFRTNQPPRLGEADITNCSSFGSFGLLGPSFLRDIGVTVFPPFGVRLDAYGLLYPMRIAWKSPGDIGSFTTNETIRPLLRGSKLYSLGWGVTSKGQWILSVLGDKVTENGNPRQGYTLRLYKLEDRPLVDQLSLDLLDTLFGAKYVLGDILESLQEMYRKPQEERLSQTIGLQQDITTILEVVAHMTTPPS